MAAREMKIHEYAELFPIHDGEALWHLRKDIKDNGQRLPIITFRGKILDGRRRYAACTQLDIAPKFMPFTGNEADALAFVVSTNLYRRHLGEGERALIAAKLATLLNGQRTAAPAGPIGPAGTSNEQAAEQMNIGTTTLKRGKKVLKQGTKKLQDAVTAGDVSVSDAAKVADAPPEAQDAAVDAVKAGKAKTASEAIIQPVPVPTDALGHAITVAASEAFGHLVKFTAIDSLVRELQKSIDELSRLPGGEQLLRHLTPTGNEAKKINKSEHLNALKRDLKFTRPYSICPYCEGKGKAGCKGCSGLGWVAEITWKNCPEDMQRRLA